MKTIFCALLVGVGVATLNGVAATEAEADKRSGTVSGSFERYPGYTGTVTPRGQVFLNKKNQLAWNLKELEDDSVGGIHIHAGKSCDSAGAHFWDLALPDPWTGVKWESGSADAGTGLSEFISNKLGGSKRSDKARGRVDLDDLAGAFSFAENVGHAVVIHATNGDRVACAVLTVGRGGKGGGGDSTPATKGKGIQAKFSVYPGYTGDIKVQGRVMLTPENVFSWALKGLEDNQDGGIHIHEGLDCPNSGAHWWDLALPDPWKGVGWQSGAGADGNQLDQFLNKRLGKSDNAQGTVALNDLVGTFSYKENVNHAVVVHASNGDRIACAVLTKD